jgi:uncharacterized membrane protein YeaQ/YmgE (transglycosylase-associated protein family)
VTIIGWIVFGLIAGFIASKIVNKQGEGMFLDIILGVVGAIVGGYLMSFFTGGQWETHFDIRSMVVSIVGAVIVLFLYHAIFGRRSSY